MWHLGKYTHLWCYCAVLLAIGCQAVRTSTKPTLFSHQLRRNQIVVHSEFLLDDQEQLVSELCDQREKVANKLTLPTTDVPIHIYLFADETSYYDFLNHRFPGFPHRRAIFVDTDSELAIYAFRPDELLCEVDGVERRSIKTNAEIFSVFRACCVAAQ